MKYFKRKNLTEEQQRIEKLRHKTESEAMLAYRENKGCKEAYVHLRNLTIRTMANPEQAEKDIAWHKEQMAYHAKCIVSTQDRLDPEKAGKIIDHCDEEIRKLKIKIFELRYKAKIERFKELMIATMMGGMTPGELRQVKIDIAELQRDELREQGKEVTAAAPAPHVPVSDSEPLQPSEIDEIVDATTPDEDAEQFQDYDTAGDTDFEEANRND